MKRVLVLSLLALASCARLSPSSDSLVEWTFDAPATKASLGDGGAFSWDKGDKIAVWDASGGTFVPFESKTGSGRFSATAPAGSRFSQLALFPVTIAAGSTASVTVPSSYSAASLEGGAGILMHAAVEDGSNVLHFKHLGAYLTVNVKDAPSSVEQVILSSPEAALSGNFALAASGSAMQISASSGTGVITVSCPHTDGQDVSFTIPVPVGRYNINVTAKDGSGEEKLSVHTSAGVSFDRAHKYTLETATVEGAALVLLSGVCEPYGTASDDDNWK